MIWNLIKDIIFPRKTVLTASGRTDTGRKRSRNEDSFAIIGNMNLFLVADGMGGHKAGDVASKSAVNFLVDYLIEQNLPKMSGNQVEIRHTLINGFIYTNKAIMKMSDDDASLGGMGCTLIACFVDHSLVHFCHIGDVRGYVAEGNSFTQLTHDHSYAAKTHQNLDSSSKVKQKTPKNVVSQAVGFPFNDGPEYNSVSNKPNSRIVICSDGLWGMLEDEKMLEIVSSCDSPEQACDLFIEKANEAGGKDNVTAVTVFLSDK